MKKRILFLLIMVLLIFSGCDAFDFFIEQNDYSVNLSIYQQVYSFAGYYNIYGSPVYVWKDKAAQNYQVECNDAESVNISEYPGDLTVTKGSDGRYTVRWETQYYTNTVTASTGVTATSGKVSCALGRIYIQVKVNEVE